MKFELHACAPDAPARQLWLMLPGAYMKPADFLGAGFVQALRERRLPHDVALLDASIPEVADGSALLFLQDFLRQQPREPAIKICLLGISLGAHLAMACLARGVCSSAEAEAAARVHSACLLAPYLGPRDVIAEMSSAAPVQPLPPAPLPQDDIDRRIWHWLRSGAAARHDLHLAYGTDDRFANAHAQMARALPAARVDVLPGGHEWPVWTQLWQRHLDAVHG